MEGSDADHPVATEREAVQKRTAATIDDLRAGRVSRGDAIVIKGAAERAIADHDLSRSVGRL